MHKHPKLSRWSDDLSSCSCYNRIEFSQKCHLCLSVLCWLALYITAGYNLKASWCTVCKLPRSQCVSQMCFQSLYATECRWNQEKKKSYEVEKFLGCSFSVREFAITRLIFLTFLKFIRPAADWAVISSNVPLRGRAMGWISAPLGNHLCDSRMRSV